MASFSSSSRKSQAPPISSLSQAPTSPRRSGLFHRPDRRALGAPRERDVRFVNAMTAAGLLDDLGELELLVVSRRLEDEESTVERSTAAHDIDLLERYYEAGGDMRTAWRRTATDRFFLHRAADGDSARTLVQRLGVLCPELDPVELHRIGGQAGPLALRSGERYAGVDEDGADGARSVRVRDLIAALNLLLQGQGVARRFVNLRTDGEREVYVAMYRPDAFALCAAGWLQDRASALVDLASWHSDLPPARSA